MEFDIKKGHGASLEGDGLKALMIEIFGNVREENGGYVTSFGATTRFDVKLLSKTSIYVNSQSDTNASIDAMKESGTKYNVFMERVTGFTSKERSKRLQKKAKEGKL